jgi:hypothetical protein
LYSVCTLFHTLKYLKFGQFYNRFKKKIFHPKPRYIKVNQAEIDGHWCKQEFYSQKLLTETDVVFLNHFGSVRSIFDWNNDKEEKLWLYNLHYFDDLNSFGSQSRHVLQMYWIDKWVIENPPAVRGNGWEPYTLSLRIVNWIKAFLSGLPTNDKVIDSLAQQVDFLSQDL